jgi:hypothetical protein
MDSAKSLGDPAQRTTDSRWRRIARSEAWRVAGASLVFGAAFSYPMLLRLFQLSEHNDWDLQMEFNWSPYYTLVHFHQIPLWDPWKCGGMAMLGNPQSLFFTPLFMLHLVLGPMVGAHLSVTVHLGIAWAGGYMLARTLGLGPLAAATAATVYPASSWFPLHVGEGHLTLMGFVYLPWLLALMVAAGQRAFAPCAIAAGALFAITFGSGGAGVIIYEAPLLVAFAIVEMVRTRRVRPLLFLTAAGTFALGLAALKLMPTIEVVLERGRAPWGVAFEIWRNLPQMLFARNQVQLAHQNVFFIEFGNYISPVFVILALAGLLMGRVRAAAWLVCGGVTILLVRGDDSAIPLFTWMRDVPILSMIRLSGRFLIPFTMCVAMLAAIGVDEIAHRLGRAGWWLGFALLTAGALDSLLVGPPFLNEAFARVPHHFDYSQNFRQLADIDVNDQTVVAQANMGFIHCYDYTQWKTSVVASNEKGYRGEQYMQGPGTVKLLRWTPNRLTYAVDARGPSVMVVNQNYEPEWHLAAGDGRVISAGGLLAVAVGAGERKLTLVYRGWPFELGLALSILTILAAVLILLSQPTCRDDDQTRQ